MRTKHLLSIYALLVILSGCGEQENDTNPTGITREFSLRVAPSLEYSEEPLTRSLPEGLYAVNVYWIGKSLTSYQPYAAGLFDDASDVTIGLIEGYQYRFDCTFLPAGEFPYSQEDKYGRPFSVSRHGETDAVVTNKLLTSIVPLWDNINFHQLMYTGDTHVSAGLVMVRPPHHRYYGTVTVNFTTNTGQSLEGNLELRRAYHTLKFTCDDLHTDESLRIDIEGTEPFYVNGSNNNATDASDERVMTFQSVVDTRNGTIRENENTAISLSYRSQKTEEWVAIFNNQNIQLHRNKRNTFKIHNIDQYKATGQVNFQEGVIGGTPDDEVSSEIIL